MHISKCDICKKEIIKGQELSVGYLFPFPQYHFCLKCGKSIFDLLKKHKLIKIK